MLDQQAQGPARPHRRQEGLGPRSTRRFSDVAVRSVGVYHDDKRGAERGLDTVFVFEVGGMRIAHLGDLGHVLDDDQLAAIGSVDVVLVPVGGVTTIDAHQATRVVDQLHPRLMVVPMHYKTDALDAVPRAQAERPARSRQPTITLTPVKARPATEIVVLALQVSGYRPAARATRRA